MILFFNFLFQDVYFLYNTQYESKNIEDFTGRTLLLNDNTLNYKTPQGLESNTQKLNNEQFKIENELIIAKNDNIKLSQSLKELEKIINIKAEEKSKEKSNLDINMINEGKNLINELTEKFKILNDNLNTNINKDKLNKLLEEIRIKDKIISNFPYKLSEGEQLLSVTLVSSDKKMHYSTLCKNTDKFSKIENMLYDVYPEYTESENNYFVNGKKINKYKSLVFNKIKNNDIITIKKIE